MIKKIKNKIVELAFDLVMEIVTFGYGIGLLFLCCKKFVKSFFKRGGK